MSGGVRHARRRVVMRTPVVMLGAVLGVVVGCGEGDSTGADAGAETATLPSPDAGVVEDWFAAD